MERLIRNLGTGKELVPVEKVQFFLNRQRDLPVPLEIIVKRGRSGLLRAGNNKIELLDWPPADAEHRF